jgi:hypothetical protein
MRGREGGSGLPFAGPKEGGGQGTKLATGVHGAGDKAVMVSKNGGHYGVGGSGSGMFSDEFLIFTMFMMLDDRG